jgi:hypothetical protein
MSSKPDAGYSIETVIAFFVNSINDFACDPLFDFCNPFTPFLY